MNRAARDAGSAAGDPQNPAGDPRNSAVASAGLHDAPHTVAVRVWDLPLRAFHWALVACIVGSVLTANVGGNAIAWHFRFGYAIFTLLLFRLAWGFAGPHHARFASFPFSPSGAWRYLRRIASESAGHTPLGALSVYAMLASLAVQVVTGLFANDAIMWEGPLKPLVSNETSDRLSGVHSVNRVVLIGLIVLHLVALAWYTFGRRQSLVRPMISGDKRLSREAAASVRESCDGLRERLLGLALLAASAGIVWVIVTRLA